MSPNSPPITPGFLATSSSQELREHLDQVRLKLEALKKDLLQKSTKIEKDLSTQGSLNPNKWDALYPSFLTLQAFMGSITSTVDMLGRLGVYIAVAISLRLVSRAVFGERLKKQALSIQGVSSLLENLNEILRAHEAEARHLQADWSKGLVDEPAYFQRQSDSFAKLLELTTASFETHQSAFELLSPGQKSFAVGPTLPKETLALLDTRIRSAHTFEDLLPIQSQILASAAHATDPRAWAALDLLEQKALRPLMGGLTLLVNNQKERKQYIKNWRSTIATGHIDLSQAVSVPGLLEQIKHLEELTHSVAFAAGNRLIAWRKLIHTIKPTISAIRLYLEAIYEDAGLDSAQKDLLAGEFRQAMEGVLAVIESEITSQIFNKYRQKSTHTAKHEAMLRRTSKSALSFDNIYHRQPFKPEEVTAFKASLMNQIAYWSLPVPAKTPTLPAQTR